MKPINDKEKEAKQKDYLKKYKHYMSDLENKNKNGIKDDFTNMVNKVLVSADYLNKRCRMKFSSENFIQFHTQTTHKIMCKINPI